MQSIVNSILNFGIIELFLILFALVNLFTFSLYALDKRRAIKNKWRISEGVLVFFTLAFGGIGAFFGMRVFRHKTKRKKFKFVVAVGFIVAIAPLVYILWNKSGT